MRDDRQWDCTGFNGDESDTSKIPHGESYAGKLHVRFDEGGAKNDEVRFEGSRKSCGHARRGMSRSTLHPMAVDPIEADNR